MKIIKAGRSAITIRQRQFESDVNKALQGGPGLSIRAYSEARKRQFEALEKAKNYRNPQ